MDNALFRSKYQTNSYSTRKRSSGRIRITYREKTGLQIAICLFILMFAGVVKNANTDVTNSLSSSISTAIKMDLNVNDIFSPVLGFFSGMYDEKSTRTSDNDVINPIPETTPNVSENEGTGDTVKAADAKNDTKAVATPAVTSNVKYGGIFITPANGVLGTQFGDIVDPLTQKKKSHKGLDIEAANGAEIKAAASGIVLEASFEKTLGYYVKIEHSNGYSTIYGQCSQLIANKGQKVNQGDIIAKVGSTGVSAGSHLHFEIWKDGVAKNPADYIKVEAK